MAQGYVLAVPSVSGDLEDYGSRFPAYLAGVERAHGLPYLVDVARLEWALLQSLDAGQSLTEACDRAWRADPQLDLVTTLRDCLSSGLLVPREDGGP